MRVFERMVDKLDARIEQLTPLTPYFAEIMDEVRSHPQEFKAVKGEHYNLTCNLEQFGIGGIFHGWKRIPDPKRGQTHKIELLETGGSTWHGMKSELEKIVAIDPCRLHVMRTDLCADFPNVSVESLNRRMRVQYKRRGAHVTEYLHIWKGEGETYYHGQRPNCFRIYNKKAQLHAKFQKDFRKLRKIGNVDNEPPEFDEIYPEIANMGMLTRVERQMGTRVPDAISTVGGMEVNLEHFNPFSPVTFIGKSRKIPPRDSYTFAQYEAGLRLMEMVEKFGYDYVRNYIVTHNPTNRARALDTYMPFLECASVEAEEEMVVSKEQLFDSYRESVRKQLAA